MLKVYTKDNIKIYEIKNKYLNESGVLNQKNVCNACKKYMTRKAV